MSARRTRQSENWPEVNRLVAVVFSSLVVSQGREQLGNH